VAFVDITPPALYLKTTQWTQLGITLLLAVGMAGIIYTCSSQTGAQDARTLLRNGPTFSEL
jgi:hypothetical protein